jgi:hypothetical protein
MIRRFHTIKTAMPGCIPAVFLFILFNTGCDRPQASSGNHTFYGPVEYNDFVVEQQNRLIVSMVNLNKAYESGENLLIRSRYDSLLLNTRSVRNELQQLSDFAGDSSLKSEACNLVAWYDSVFHTDYHEMVQIYLKGANSTDEDIQRFVEISRAVSINESQRIKAFELVQIRFARKFGFEFAQPAVGVYE